MEAKIQKSTGTVQPLNHRSDRSKVDHNITQSLGVEGVAEDLKKTKAENLVSKPQKDEVLIVIKEKPSIFIMKRFDKFDE